MAETRDRVSTVPPPKSLGARIGRSTVTAHRPHPSQSVLEAFQKPFESQCLYLQGVPVAVIAAWIGHKDASVTMRQYTDGRLAALAGAGGSLDSTGQLGLRAGYRADSRIGPCPK